MTVWAQGFTMMLLDIGVLPWLTVLMEQGDETLQMNINCQKDALFYTSHLCKLFDCKFSLQALLMWY